MRHSDISLARIPQAEPEVRLDALYAPFLRRWRLVAACVAATCSVAVGFILVPDREYSAQLVVSAVPNTNGASLAGGLSSLLGSATLGGVQSTPYFITRLLLLRGVLREVALTPSGDGSKRTVIERVLEEPAAAMRPEDLDRGMREIVSTEVDKQTGLVTLSVTHADSGLARDVAQRVLAAASRTFASVLHAQARDQRASGQAQVDSARRQLRAAEARLQSFQTSHRIYQPYSPAATERQRLDRELQTAQAVYTDAVSDHQSAVARELSETPAVVIVDPIPPVLTPVPRQAALKLVLAGVLGLLIAGLVLAARGEFRAQPVRMPMGVSTAA